MGEKVKIHRVLEYPQKESTKRCRVKQNKIIMEKGQYLYTIFPVLHHHPSNMFQAKGNIQERQVEDRGS